MNEIKVRGLDGQETLFRVDLDTITAGQLKQQIHDKLTIAVDGQRLLFGGQILDGMYNASQIASLACDNNYPGIYLTNYPSRCTNTRVL